MEGNICAKILRSLPELFMPKVTVIQEVRAIDTMNADELVRSLQTYELQFTNPKKTSIALKTSTSKYKNQEETNSESKIQHETNSESEDEEDMVSLAKKLYKYFKSKRGSNVRKQEKSFDNNNNNNQNQLIRKSKDVQCYNSRDYGHIASSCPTKVKTKKKGLVANVTWDDTSESESESDHEEGGSYLV